MASSRHPETSSRRKSAHLWLGALLWLVAIAAWQTVRGLDQQQDDETIAKAYVETRQRAKAAVDMCAACHTLTYRQNRIGPPLLGIMGKRAGTEPGFAYSDAMAKSGMVWDRDTLRRFLLDPQGTIPGTAMGIAGMPADDVQSVVDYLETQ
jgi:cytochrome c